MPNWCQNKIVVNGSDEAIEEFLDWLGDGKNFLSKILPTPKELAGGKAPFSGSKEESAALVAKYGFDNWYDWNINNWGTKWDVDIFNIEEGSYCSSENLYGDLLFEATLGFDSAWGPPDRAIALLAKQFSNLNFSLAYLEEGMCLTGSQRYEGGKLVSEFHSDDSESDEWKEFAWEEFGYENDMEDEEEEASTGNN